MNPVEIEQAITDLADQPFDRENFPFAFLEAFGNKETTIKRLRAGASNKSDLGGVLQTNNIHILTADTGGVTRALKALKESPATTSAKAKFILATGKAVAHRRIWIQKSFVTGQQITAHTGLGIDQVSQQVLHAVNHHGSVRAGLGRLSGLVQRPERGCRHQRHQKGSSRKGNHKVTKGAWCWNHASGSFMGIAPADGSSDGVP